MKINKIEISRCLKEKINIFCRDTTGSTNDDAKKAARELRYAPSLFVCERQTAGRGRRGRSFYSPDTGLYMTLMLPINGVCGVQKVTCAAAVAAAEAIEELTFRKTEIKWVNDILIRGKKVAGILCELLCDEENIPRAVGVGVGVNLTTTDFPAAFCNRAGTIGDVDKNLLCARITDHLLYEYARLDENHFLKNYTERSIALGKTITFEKAGVTHTAKAVAITGDGGLLVEESGEKTVLTSGEISIVIQNA